MQFNTNAKGKWFSVKQTLLWDPICGNTLDSLEFWLAKIVLFYFINKIYANPLSKTVPTIEWQVKFKVSMKETCNLPSKQTPTQGGFFRDWAMNVCFIDALLYRCLACKQLLYPSMWRNTLRSKQRPEHKAKALKQSTGHASLPHLILSRGVVRMWTLHINSLKDSLRCYF